MTSDNHIRDSGWEMDVTEFLQKLTDGSMAPCMTALMTEKQSNSATDQTRRATDGEVQIGDNQVLRQVGRGNYDDVSDCQKSRVKQHRDIASRRSNLELAEKCHKAELKVTDLQEEAEQVLLTLQRERQRCLRLEDVVNTSYLARRLDLTDIWRLLQKDKEAEKLEKQVGKGLHVSTEEIKEEIIKEIKARDEILKHISLADRTENVRNEEPLISSLQRHAASGKIRLYCCGYRCVPHSSPLVDALTIDFCNGNYYYPQPKTCCTSSAVSDRHVKYLHVPCEDAGCDDPCRASHSVDLHFQGVNSCPALQHWKLGQDFPAALNDGRSFEDVVTAPDDNSESQAGEGHFLQNSDSQMVAFLSPSAITVNRQVTMRTGCPELAESHSDGVGHVSADSCENCAPSDPSSLSEDYRLDISQVCTGWSGKVDTYASCTPLTDSDSGGSNPDVVLGVPLPQTAHYQNQEESARAPSPQVSHSGQCSAAETKRMRFLAAVEKSKSRDRNMDSDGLPSYCEVIDPPCVAGDLSVSHREKADEKWDYTSNSQRVETDCTAENKIHLEKDAHTSGKASSTVTSRFFSSSLSTSTDSDNALWKSSTPSESSADKNAYGSLASYIETSDKQSVLAAYGSSHRPPTSSDVKCYLTASEEERKDMAAQPACNADNMPLHFKQRRELTPTSESSPDSGAAAPSLTSAASASSVTSTQPPLILVPGSPPQTPRTAHDSHVLAATPSRLATLRQNNLARKREQMKTMKMPELSEHVESSSDSEVPAAVNGGPFSSQTRESKDSSSSSRAQSSASRAPLISVSSGDNDDNSKMDSGSSTSNGELVCRPPSPTDNLVTPSIPDSFLKQLGLSAAVPAPDKEQQQQEQDSGEQQQTPGVDQLPDKQLESRFNSLALAFKTDRLTLDKRLGIQERSRDVAEQNIDKELQGLRDATEVLHQLCGEDGGQEVISKIQQHLDILEMSVARVSSRAEVFGAVQQEKRMCLAMDVMITFTENIKRLRATELNEVSEAKKLLSDRDRLKTGFSLDTFSIGDRRSASVCAGLNNPRTTRRRSEVALPRFFGGTGSPSLHVSSSMESDFLWELSQSSLGSGCRTSVTDSSEEPRQRFQSATANVTVRNVVTSALRRASMDRQRNVTLQSSSLSFSPSSSANNSLDKPQDKDQLAKQNSQEEEAYRHGYEEGVKASLSRELTDLREQQTNINTSLEEVMDRVETLQQQDEEESEIDDLISKLKDIVVKVRQWMSNPNWQSASSTLRKVAAAIIFLAAVAVIVTTFSPLMSDNSTNRNHTQPAH